MFLNLHVHTFIIVEDISTKTCFVAGLVAVPSLRALDRIRSGYGTSVPSPLARAHGKGPIGCDNTSLMRSSRFSATRIMWPNTFLSVFRTTCFACPCLLGFFLMSENVFSFFFVICSWNCLVLDFASNRSCLKASYASSPILWAARRSLATSAGATAAVDKLINSSWSWLNGFNQQFSRISTRDWTPASSLLILGNCGLGWLHWKAVFKLRSIFIATNVVAAKLTLPFCV